MKSKGKIEKIDFGQHESEIMRIWNGDIPASLIQKWKDAGLTGKHPERYYNPGTKLARLNKIRRLVGYGPNLIGICSMCENLNTHLLKYKTQGVIIIERYCQEHIDKITG